MGAERGFDMFALGNVGGNAAGRIGFAGGIAKREFDRDISMQSIQMGRLFFILYGVILLEHVQVICTKRVRNLAGKDLMIGMTDNLIRGQVEELFKPAIGLEIPAIRVFDVDHRRGVIGHVPQELFATTSVSYTHLTLPTILRV